MSEPREVYLDELNACPKCPKCGMPYGQYVPYGGKVMLKTGNMIMRQFYGFCRCGFELNFHSSDQDLERLIARVKRLRKENL